jgi:hypothetical protein
VRNGVTAYPLGMIEHDQLRTGQPGVPRNGTNGTLATAYPLGMIEHDQLRTADPGVSGAV